MDFRLRKLQEKDLVTVMNWRMSEAVTKYMNTDPVLTYEGQLKWYSNLQNDNTSRYWIIEVEGEPAGIINLLQIDWENKNTSWGYYIGEEKLRSLKLAVSLEMSLYDYCFNLLGFNEVHNEVFKLNEGVWKLHLACGCSIDKIVEDEVTKNNRSYDIVHLTITKERWNEFKKGKKYSHIDFDVYDDRILTLKSHHIGLAAADINEAAKRYCNIGWKTDSDVIIDSYRNVKLAFLSNDSVESVIELVSPLSEKSPVTKTLQNTKNVTTPYHICYEVDDLDLIIGALKKREYILTSPPAPAVAFDGRRVAFLLNKNTGLLELLERE